MRAILYVRYIGKLHRSAELNVPDGLMVIDVQPDPLMAMFKIHGLQVKLPALKFYRITGCEDIFEGAVFWADVKQPLYETGQSFS